MLKKTADLVAVGSPKGNDENMMMTMTMMVTMMMMMMRIIMVMTIMVIQIVIILVERYERQHGIHKSQP